MICQTNTIQISSYNNNLMADLFIHQNLHQSIIVTAKHSHYTVWYVCVDYELLKPLQGGPVIIVCTYN